MLTALSWGSLAPRTKALQLGCPRLELFTLPHQLSARLV